MYNPYASLALNSPFGVRNVVSCVSHKFYHVIFFQFEDVAFLLILLSLELHDLQMYIK